ncbi:GHMP kinase [Roseomonas sp. NAR14]|uniref:GHMP kinase n=1 Tax=Roseomonas acroporae TaxID=2937791 RepID=A0A9X1Y953_9PROT|nr:GHMP kinase [Roseomonas acroporae]MCK8784397.1 GHMP kinase [Roseomonas acroporae]
MIVRARAPFRLGLAGGGTDVSPYMDEYGGAVLNATIASHAWVTLRSGGSEVVLESADTGLSARYPATGSPMPRDGVLDLVKAVHDRIVREFHHGRPLPLTIQTYSEAPPGSGLGSSSTLVVALIQAYEELLKLPLGEYDIARLAFQIEREDMALAGGRQDQYAAAFGGFNFMEFTAGERVIVNPLRIKPDTVRELEARMLVCFTGVSRESARIIEDQRSNVLAGVQKSIDAMHNLKANAVAMKEALLHGDLDGMAEVLREGWQSKRAMAAGISNSHIEELWDIAAESGAYAGKVSGAGGGGFMMFFCPLEKKPTIISRLEARGCRVAAVVFTAEGANAWSVR